MIIDRYTKAVLTLIAISLFVISLNPWIVPTKAYAEKEAAKPKLFNQEAADRKRAKNAAKWKQMLADRPIPKSKQSVIDRIKKYR